MIKKGDLFNQLAIISDLLENINLETESKVVLIELKPQQYNELYDTVEKKFGKKNGKPGQSFNVSIGTIDIIFNMSNV